MNQIFAQLFYEMEKHRDTVLVTLIDTAGSAPGRAVPRCWWVPAAGSPVPSAAALWNAAARRWPWPC